MLIIYGNQFGIEAEKRLTKAQEFIAIKLQL
jgi:hypothetical protein